MANSGIVSEASSHSAVFSHSSPFLGRRLDYGIQLPQPRTGNAPSPECDVLSEETALFDGSLLLDDEEEEENALLGDDELCSPVEDTAPARIVESERDIAPTPVSSTSISQAGDLVHVRSGGSSSSNAIDAQDLTSVFENKNPCIRKAQPGSRPVDIVSPQTSTAKGPKSCKKSGKELMSIRESLLVEAWERKRDYRRLDETSIEMEVERLDQFGRCASFCGKSLRSPTETSRTRTRARSLTGDDFDELRGFMDLGFRFCEDCIPHLGDTLPALEVYCAMKQTLQDSPSHSNVHGVPDVQSPVGSSPSPTSSWKVASPGDQPQDVKARLRLWARTVACGLRQSY